jgi:hypothetical protein
MSVDSSAPRSRRAVLAAALGGLGAVIASRFASPDAIRAANGDAVTVGNAFTGTAPTSLTSTAATGAAVEGHSGTGTGVWATSDDNTPSTFVSGNRTGLVGIGGAATGIAASTDETGVYGFSDVSANAAGIWGDTFDGTGVIGTGFWGVYGNGQVGVFGDVFSGGTGVYGFVGDVIAPAPTPGVGVEARANTTAETALNVIGKAKFSRSGRGRVLGGHSSRVVTLAGVVKDSSYVIATLQTNRPGVYIQSVVTANGSFTVNLNKSVPGFTYFGYLVIN